MGDGSGWVLSHEAREIHRIARRLGFKATLDLTGNAQGVVRQRIYYTDQFILPWLRANMPLRNACGVAYFHGKPGAGRPEFDALWKTFCILSEQLWRVHVSCRSMEALVLESRISPSAVHRIPIGINLEAFPIATPQIRAAARQALGMPESAVVVGSFQKDGTGWGEGESPKLIKGPDILVEVCDRLYRIWPETMVLLTGPARGYVRKGLTARRVPHVHHWLDDYHRIAQCYHACDLVLVTSREEGGPKAVLESMATGVPLVSTAVGQAADLVVHGTNGWLTSIDDVEGLVEGARAALALGDDERRALRSAARKTAEADSYDAQLPRWRAFLS